MKKQLVTPQTLTWLRQTLEFLDGSPIDDNIFTDQIIRIGKGLGSPDERIAALEPDEVEFVHLAISCLSIAIKYVAPASPLAPVHTEGYLTKYFVARNFEMLFSTVIPILVGIIANRHYGCDALKFSKNRKLGLYVQNNSLCVFWFAEPKLRKPVIGNKMELNPALSGLIDLDKWTPDVPKAN